MRRKTIGSLLLSVVLCGGAVSYLQAAPVAKIAGKATAQPGEIVQLKTTGSVGGPMFVWQSFPTSMNHFFLPVLLPIGANPDGSYQFEHAAIFSSLNKGRYAVILAVAQADQVALALHEIRVGEPGPDPNPDPDPEPEPDPPPPDQKLWGAIFVEETQQRTPQIASVVTSGAVSDYVRQAGLIFLVVDQDAVQASLQPYIAKGKAAGIPQLYLVGDQGRIFFDGELPATPEAFISLMKEYQ